MVGIVVATAVASIAAKNVAQMSATTVSARFVLRLMISVLLQFDAFESQEFLLGLDSTWSRKTTEAIFFTTGQDTVAGNYYGDGIA